MKIKFEKSIDAGRRITAVHFPTVAVCALLSCFLLGSVDAVAQRLNASGDRVGEIGAKRGELLFADDFERADVGRDWIEHFKEVSLEDGVLRISQVPDLHPAIARHEMDLQNTIFEFDVRLRGAKRAILVVNGENKHVFHVALRELGSGLEVSIQDYSNGRVIASATAPKKEAGLWHRITLALVDDQLEAIVDGASVVRLKSSGLAAAKDLFQLNGVGSHVEYDNVEVWSVASE